MSQKNHPRHWMTNPQGYAFDPSSDFQEGDAVETEDGKGTIVCQDSYIESFPAGNCNCRIWLPRWGIQLFGYDNVRYYPIESITN